MLVGWLIVVIFSGGLLNINLCEASFGCGTERKTFPLAVLTRLESQMNKIALLNTFQAETYQKLMY